MDGALTTQTIIGLKRLVNAKQRLMPEVSPEERHRLMLAMLASVAAAARAAALGPVALATSEPTAPALGRALGIAVVSDGDLPWNEGLVHALAGLRPSPASVMYLAGDLPLLTAAELRAFAAATTSPGVGIARARDGGTNALIVSPADALHPLFGVPQSCTVHADAARARGIACTVVDMAGLALDVDTVADAWDAALIPRPGAPNHLRAGAAPAPPQTG